MYPIINTPNKKGVKDGPCVDIIYESVVTKECIIVAVAFGTRTERLSPY